MRIGFALLLVAHALLHLTGFAEAFELASLVALQTPIPRPMGVLWLMAAALLLGASAALLAAPRWFWMVGAAGLVVSQLVIIASWSDAHFGTIANVLLLAAVVHAAFSWGPFGLHAEYERLVRDGIARTAGDAGHHVVSEADLVALPPLVQRYLRFTAVVGTPRVESFRARMTGRIRSSPAAPWMPFVAEQQSFFGPPRRYFFMRATRSGWPLDGLHVYGETDATMRIRLLSLVPVVDLSGPEMVRTETVTILNDMCILAPGSLLDPAIRWRELDAHSVEATYTNGRHSVRGVLIFGEAGALVDFWSDDRPALAEDGKTTIPARWSTPVQDYRTMGLYRLASGGEARYATPTGGYAYIEFDGIEVSTEPGPYLGGPSRGRRGW